MTWDRRSFPDSFKNLNEYVRDKAIDIANTMVDEGYDESEAIPIAISQAKLWYEDASPFDKSQITDKDLKESSSSQGPSGARLTNSDVVVSYDDDKEMWQVKSQGARQVDSYHDYKADAVDRAEEIAQNRGTQVIQKIKDES